jgi:hypothetical protein
MNFPAMRHSTEYKWQPSAGFIEKMQRCWLWFCFAWYRKQSDLFQLHISTCFHPVLSAMVSSPFLFHIAIAIVATCFVNDRL